METANKSSNNWKYLRWGVSSVFGLLVSAVLGGLAVSYFYEDEIKAYVLQELNKNLKTELKVGDNTEVSFIRKFPYTSVKLNDVYALEVSKKTNKDTLFSFDGVFLQFNIVDILRQNYNIRNVQVEDGFVRIKVDKNGVGNYDIFKKTDFKQGSFSLKLDKVFLKGITFNYANRSTDLDFSGKADELNLSGNFSDKVYDMDLLGRAILWNIDHKGTRLLKTKRIRIEGQAKVDNVLKQYIFEDASLKVADLQLALNGKIAEKGANTFVDLNLRGKDMNIGSILSLVPEKYNDEIEQYKSTGTFYFTGNITGLIGQNKFPQVEGSFGIKDAEITADGKGLPLKSVNLTGYYTNGLKQNGETTRIEIKKFHATMGSGKINGSFYAENFASPTVNLACNANLNLTELQKFVQLDTLQEIAGQVALNLDFKSHLLKPWQLTKADFSHAAISGKLDVKDAYFMLKGNPNDFRDFDGTFNFKGNELNIEDFSGFISESDFSLNGYFRNLLPYLLLDRSGDLYMNATLTADRINIDDILAKMPKNRNQDTVFNLKIHPNADVVLLLDVEEINFKKFKAANVSGNVMMKNQIVNLNGINLETLGGEISLSGEIDGRKSNKIMVNGHTSVRNADMASLFTSMDNFGQQFITAENIKGTAGLSATFAFPMSPALEINTNELEAEANVSVEKGELQNFMPLQKLARFVGLDELKNIRFATLQNTISIKDSKISIPQMDLNNNLLNIKLEGTHSFDNSIDYHFNLKLSDVLAQKMNKTVNTEFGEEENDAGKTSIFLKMTGKASNPIFAYDMGGVKQKLKTDWKAEKKNIKTTLRNEFSRQLNDTVTKASTGQKPKLKMSWEESQPAESDEPEILKAKQPGSKIDTPKTRKNGRAKEPKEEVEKAKVDWE